MVQELFSGHDVKLDFIHREIKFSRSHTPMQLDIYIPSLSLAFEYQGEQHYFTHYLFGSPDIQQQRDVEKQQTCKAAGITLVHIPYWWDKEKSSLVATIRHHRSDLLQAEILDGTPIPLTPPTPVYTQSGMNMHVKLF
jgi:hypothetical protein